MGGRLLVDEFASSGIYDEKKNKIESSSRGAYHEWYFYILHYGRILTEKPIWACDQYVLNRGFSRRIRCLGA